MGLIEDVKAAAAASRPGPKCFFARPHLDADDQADLERLLADPFVPTAAIYRALKARNLPVGEQTVGRHRQRKCSCPV